LGRLPDGYDECVLNVRQLVSVDFWWNVLTRLLPHLRIPKIDKGVQSVKGQTDMGVGKSTAATLGSAAVGRGIFHSGLRYVPAAEDAGEESSGEMPVIHSAFSRRIAFQYGWQMFICSLPLLLTDIFALAGAIFVCRELFLLFGLSIGIDISKSFLPIAAGFLLLNVELGLYPGVRLSPVEELRRLVVSITCMFVVWAVGVIMHFGTLDLQRWFLLAVYCTCLLTLPIGRTWVRQFLGRWTKWGIPVLVCGDDTAAVRSYQWLTDNRHLGFRPVGVIAERDALEVDPDDSWYAGSWEQTSEIAAKRGVYWAVVVPTESRPAAISSLIADYLFTIPHVHVLSELTGLPDHWNPQQLDGLTGIHLQQNLMLPLPRLTKRCMDFVASIMAVIVLLPLLFYLAVAVKMSSRGPILYGHERIGRNGRRFRAWKFRTMFQNSSLVLDQYLEANPELQEEWTRDHKLKYDPRITRIGRLMRKTSLDELPQLWNVILGDMSLVGPRPIVDAEVAKYGLYYGLYTMVKPGITGLWQVSGRNNTTYEERVQLDAYYVRNWSPWMDVFLLLKTIRIVLFAKGAY
jgi:Undecaprenyl-phosphate galactose phosphotransferase WbaP